MPIPHTAVRPVRVAENESVHRSCGKICKPFCPERQRCAETCPEYNSPDSAAIIIHIFSWLFYFRKVNRFRPDQIRIIHRETQMPAAAAFADLDPQYLIVRNRDLPEYINVANGRFSVNARHLVEHLTGSMIVCWIAIRLVTFLSDMTNRI